MKSGRADLNRRPHGPEPCALSELRYAPVGAGQSIARRLLVSKSLSRKIHMYSKSFPLTAPCAPHKIGAMLYSRACMDTREG